MTDIEWVDFYQECHNLIYSGNGCPKCQIKLIKEEQHKTYYGDCISNLDCPLLNEER